MKKLIIPFNDNLTVYEKQYILPKVFYAWDDKCTNKNIRQLYYFKHTVEWIGWNYNDRHFFTTPFQEPIKWYDDRMEQQQWHAAFINGMVRMAIMTKEHLSEHTIAQGMVDNWAVKPGMPKKPHASTGSCWPSPLIKNPASRDNLYVTEIAKALAFIMTVTSVE